MLKEIAKNALFAVPVLRRAIQRRQVSGGLIPHSLTESYARDVFRVHARAVERIRPIDGADVLEIGPGGNVATAALFLEHGAASATCIDIIPWRSESAVYEQLGVADQAARVDYRCPAPVEAMPFAGESFDVVYSQACFQHFADPEAAVREIARVLRRGGVTTHEIDLRDHNGTQDTDPLRLLRASDVVWKLATSHRPGQPNRWRASDICAAFRGEGLTIDVFTPERRHEVTAEERSSMARRFREKTLDDLGVLTFFLVASKP